MCFSLFPQSSQLYYDANTGMYYYYDPESGKYQFHSRIEVPTAHPEVEQTPQRKTKDWKNRKAVKNTDRASCPDGGVRYTLSLHSSVITEICVCWLTLSLPQHDFLFEL